MASAKNNTLQKILAVIILLLVPVFVMREYKALKPKNTLFFSLLSEPSINEFSKSADKSFVILIFCNESVDFCDKNLTSVFNQTYRHYRVILIGNTIQGTNFKKTQEFVRSHGYNTLVTFVPMDQIPSYTNLLYQTVQSCRDDEVIVQIEPNDWFVDNQVLEKLNQTYLDPDVWLTYGECLTYPSLEHTKLKPHTTKTLSDYSISKAPWMSSHLKTYYAGLFKQLSLSESLSKESREDKKLFAALLKMSQWHVRFIPEALYVHTPQEPVLTKKEIVQKNAP